MAKLVQLPNTHPVNPSEAQVVQYLRDHLPNTYTLIPNAEIVQSGSPPFEYDLIVLAPHAVYVVEVKRWLGGIQGDDFTWLIGGLHYRPNPWLTTNNKARALKSAIEKRQPGIGPFWVEAAVAIADEQAELALRGECRSRVFRYTDLPAFLTDSQALGGKANDLRSVQAYLEKAVLEAARGRQDQPLQFGSYRVLETLSRRDAAAEFLARSLLLPNSPPARLRVFSYDPYLPPDERERQQARIRREAEALFKIGYHPNLITLRSFEADAQDPNLFVEVTDWSEAGTLRALMSDTVPLSLEHKLNLALGIAAGLKAVHTAGVIHRDLRPENVLIAPDGTPRLMNFDHARLEAPEAHTISPRPPEPGISLAYLAPELEDPSFVASPACDLYSLGMILFELLVGEPLYRSPDEARRATAPCGPLEFVSDIPAALDELVCKLLHADPQKRPQSAQQVLEVLQQVREKPSGTIPPAEEVSPARSEPAPVEVEPALFEDGSLIDGKYIVQKRLPPGGSGQVYQVYDGMFDRVYALKVFNNTNLATEFLQQEARTLLELDHPNIVKVHSWGRLPRSERLYLVSEFIEGEELSEYTRPDHHLSVRQAVQVIVDLLGALEAIHPQVERLEELKVKLRAGELSYDDPEYEEYQTLSEKGWLHRDIKPSNLVLSPRGVCLIDFNIAARASEARHTFIGTRGYMLPTAGFTEWGPNCDLFAAGIVLYELVTGRHPYPERVPGSAEATDPRQYVPELSERLTGLLLRAVSCDPTIHYHSARRFRQDLLDLEEDYLQAPPPHAKPMGLELSAEEHGLANYNPYVTRLLKLYSQARRDNSGTRGLDEIARLTYVHTRLDRVLQPSILDGSYRLVIITGNAGDGKTAFIQNLEKAVEAQGSRVEHPTPNSSRFRYHGLEFVANYDGSQDEGAERTNDQVLSEFFNAFDDAHYARVNRDTPVHLIAINEGRLVDFFSSLWTAGHDDSAATQHFQKLGACIQAYFERTNGASGLPEWLLIVDLNQRSVISSDPQEEGTSILDRQLQALLRSELWQPCQDCALKSRCFIKYNVDTLTDPVSGAAVRERLRALFEIVHLRRQLHITMRDLRSALSWMLLHDHTCQDVASLLASNASPAEHLQRLYFNAYGQEGAPNAGQGEDRLVRLLRQIDPAEVANPGMDRTLHFRGPEGLPMLVFDNRSSLADEWLEEWSPQSHSPVVHLQKHAFLRRLAFFERRDGGWRSMLPYRHWERFENIVQQRDEALDGLKSEVGRGFSFVEGARHKHLQTYICIRAGQTVKAHLRSFRLFPLTDFEIEIPQFQESRYLEHTTDHFSFIHNPQDASLLIEGAQKAALSVSLDLLELLEEINNGYVPSPDDISGIFINLLTFKNALAHLPYNRVLLTRDDRHYYELTQTANAGLRLQVWSLQSEASDEN